MADPKRAAAVEGRASASTESAAGLLDAVSVLRPFFLVLRTLAAGDGGDGELFPPPSTSLGMPTEKGGFLAACLFGLGERARSNASAGDAACGAATVLLELVEPGGNKCTGTG
jgi:hypothetical protein